MWCFEASNQRRANLYILSAMIPGYDELPIGLLLEDTGANGLHIMLRSDWEVVAPVDYQDYLAAVADDLNGKAVELGAHELLALLTDQLSNFLHITDPEPIVVADFPGSLTLLFEQRIQGTRDGS